MHAARLQEARDRNPQILPYHNSLLALCRCGQVCALSSACFRRQGFDASHSVLGRWMLLVGNVPFEEVKCAPGASDPAAHPPYSVHARVLGALRRRPRDAGAGMAGNPHGLACALLLRRRSPVSVASCARVEGALHPRATVVCASRCEQVVAGCQSL